MNIHTKIREENLKHTILEELTTLVNKSSQKCEEIINSKDLHEQNFSIFDRNFSYLGYMNKFNKLKDQCEYVLKNISRLIQRSL